MCRSVQEAEWPQKDKFWQARQAVLQHRCGHMGNERGARKLTNQHIIKWVVEQAALCWPDSIFWCDGSEEEKNALTRAAVQAGVFIELNQKKLPGCYLHRSNPNDVARSEQCTFICTPTKEEAGPTNNWVAPREM